LASLGREAELRAIFEQIGSRRLSRADWQKSFVGIKQALATMERNPDVSFKCGTLALQQVASMRYPSNSSLAQISRIPSPASGFSLSALVHIAETNGLDIRAVVRQVGEEIVVPSVIHWRQDHYAAIVQKRGDN
jgi:hypothetical protein